MHPIADVPRRPAIVVLALALLLGLPAGAAVAAGSDAPPPGSDLSGRALAALAARSEHDPAALAQLEQVRRVDGQAVDLRTALATSSPDERRVRLRELAGQSPGAAVAGGVASPPPVTSSPTAGADPAAARRDAAQVLAQRRFHAAHEPQPLRGVLRWIGDRARPVFDPIGRWFRSVGRTLFGNTLSRIVTVVVLAGLVVWGAVVLSRRRGAAAVRSGQARLPGGRVLADPDELDQEADRAEAAGDLERALRLRFQAGLVRLHLLGVLDRPVDGPNGELAGTLGSEEFDGLAHTFDEVVYGRREPDAEDLVAARRSWPKVLEGQRR